MLYTFQLFIFNKSKYLRRRFINSADQIKKSWWLTSAQTLLTKKKLNIYNRNCNNKQDVLYLLVVYI